MVPANPGPLKAYTQWNGPWRLEWAAGGGREWRSRPRREGGGGSGLPESSAAAGWGAAAQWGGRGQAAGNGDPASEAAPGKKAWAEDRQWGRQAWKDGAPAACASLFFDSQPICLSQLISSSVQSLFSRRPSSSALSALTRGYQGMDSDGSALRPLGQGMWSQQEETGHPGGAQGWQC